MLAQFGSAAEALRVLPKILPPGTAPKIPDRTDIAREWDLISNYGADLIRSDDPRYPTMLSHLPAPPPTLSCLGSIELAQRRCVAIVGARQASAAGRKLARDIADDLSDAGIVIVSGLARGIDGEAHWASLDGGTIAVLGGGVDHIYPRQHAALYREIARQGLLLSENPFGHRAKANDFPRRNRIVTGLAEGVVLIEAAERSGSLISARTALEQNRDVFAVPGSPLDPRYAGTNRLLRDGATLVRNADDVIAALSRPETRRLEAPSGERFGSPHTPATPIPKEQIDDVLSALGPTPTLIDDIARAANVGIDRCRVILVELELQGRALTYSGGLAARNFE